MKTNKVKKWFLATILIVTAVMGGLSFVMPTVQAQEDETYVIATDATFAPFSFVDVDGELSGIDIDVFKAAMEVEGLNL